jgi:hypothetical protein
MDIAQTVETTLWAQRDLIPFPYLTLIVAA